MVQPYEINPECPDNPKCLRAIHFPIHNTRDELENIIIMHEDITSKVNLKNRIKELEEFQELSVGREIILNKLQAELEELNTKSQTRQKVKFSGYKNGEYKIKTIK